MGGTSPAWTTWIEMVGERNSRRHVRIPLELPATVGNGATGVVASTLDVSQGGLAVRCEWLWPPGSRLTVRFALGAQGAAPPRITWVRAVVQRCNAGVMGLRVTARGPAFSRLLQSIVPRQ